MVKKTIKYTDYDGNEREEDFYFNLTKAELMELELSINGGLEKQLRQIISEQDTSKIIPIFKDIILRSYGKKSNDGKRFVKDPELTKEFTQTEAYSQLFMELATNEKEASKFINGIIPADVAAGAQQNNKPVPAPALESK